MALTTPDPVADDLLDELQQRLRSIPAGEPEAALGVLAVALERLVDETERPLIAAADALGLLDESAQPHVRHALRGFLQSAALKTGRGDVLHASSTRFLDALARACHLVLQRDRYSTRENRALMAQVGARLMRTGAGRLKWDHLVYGPYNQRLWGQMGAAFLDAQEADRLDLAVKLRAGRATETSAHREFVRMVALGCSGLDQLPVELIDVADRLIHYLSPAMHLAAVPLDGARFYISPALGGEPRRIVRALDPDAAAWYFSPLKAERLMEELEAMLHKGMVPGALDGGAGARERILACIRHLRRAWYDTPVARRHRRHAVGGRIAAVRGFVSLRQALREKLTAPAQTWDLRDVSVNGLGALAPLGANGMPRIGELVAVRPEEADSWRVGMVRRVRRDDATRALVGVETFATAPRIVRADDGRAPLDVLLCDPVRRGATLRVVATANSLRASAPLFVAEDGVLQKLKPLGDGWRGNEFEVRTYLVL